MLLEFADRLRREVARRLVNWLDHILRQSLLTRAPSSVIMYRPLLVGVRQRDQVVVLIGGRLHLHHIIFLNGVALPVRPDDAIRLNRY